MSVKTVEFSRSFLFPWVKGRISLEDRMVKTRRVHTVLGIIPAGTDNQTMPLSNISAVGVNTRYNIKTILIGAALAVGGVLCLTGSFLLALVLLLAGAAFIGSGILTEINFSKGGGSYIIKAACYNKKKIVAIAGVINQALADSELGKDSREGAKLNAELTSEAFARQMDRLIGAAKKD